MSSRLRTWPGSGRVRPPAAAGCRASADLLAVYTVNRDVVHKGRRLENLFWRIWGSERTGRPFSGRLVSAIFMVIYNNDEEFVQVPQKPTPSRAPATSPAALPTPATVIPTPPSQLESSTPHASLEIECPPTPPPSPLLTDALTAQSSDQSRRLRSSIDSLQQTPPPRPPSPPVPVNVPPPPDPPARPANTAAAPNGHPLLPAPLNLAPPSVNGTALSSSVSSRSSSATTDSSGNRRSTDSTRPPRGRRKKTSFAVGTKAAGHPSRPRGIRPPATARRKAQSTSNTAANSPTQHMQVDIPRSLPSSGTTPRRPPRRQDSTLSEPDDARAREEVVKAAWLVDPETRAKYLDRKRGGVPSALVAPALAGKTAPTTAVVEDTATAHTTGRRGRRKNVLVVDEIVPLKGLKEEDEGSPTPPPAITVGDDLSSRFSSGTTSAAAVNSTQRKLDPMGVRDSILPANLVRRKSELTMLFENAKKETAAAARK